GGQRAAGANGDAARPSATTTSIHGSAGHRLANAAAPMMADHRPTSWPISPPPVTSRFPMRSRNTTLEARKLARAAAGNNGGTKRPRPVGQPSDGGRARRSMATPPKNRSGAPSAQYTAQITPQPKTRMSAAPTVAT